MNPYQQMKLQFISQCKNWDDLDFNQKVAAFAPFWNKIKQKYYPFYNKAHREIYDKYDKYGRSLSYSDILEVFDLATTYFNNRAFL